MRQGSSAQEFVLFITVIFIYHYNPVTTTEKSQYVTTMLGSALGKWEGASPENTICPLGGNHADTHLMRIR